MQTKVTEWNEEGREGDWKGEAGRRLSSKRIGRRQRGNGRAVRITKLLRSL